MRPQQYPNQDIDKITAAKYSTQAAQLDIAGYFDGSLILNMFLCASRDDKEIPPYHEQPKENKVESFQQAIIFLSNKGSRQSIHHTNIILQ
jgi:hypothetical protein